MTRLRIIIIIEIVLVLAVIWITVYLGISPLLKASKRIREDRPIQESGANEFRYLARAYNNLQEKLFAMCRNNGMRVLTENYMGHWFPSHAYEEGGIHEAIADYEDAVFFDILAEELARRDMSEENVDPENVQELSERMDNYLTEFERNGIDNITIENPD